MKACDVLFSNNYPAIAAHDCSTIVSGIVSVTQPHVSQRLSKFSIPRKLFVYVSNSSYHTRALLSNESSRSGTLTGGAVSSIVVLKCFIVQSVLCWLIAQLKEAF